MILFLKMGLKVATFKIWYSLLDLYPESKMLKKKKSSSIGEHSVFTALQETLDVGFEIVYGLFSTFHPMS